MMSKAMLSMSAFISKSFGNCCLCMLRQSRSSANDCRWGKLVRETFSMYFGITLTVFGLRNSHLRRPLSYEYIAVFSIVDRFDC